MRPNDALSTGDGNMLIKLSETCAIIRDDETPAYSSPARLSRHPLLLPAGEHHRARTRARWRDRSLGVRQDHRERVLSRDVVVHLLAGGGLDGVDHHPRFSRRLRHGALHLSRQVADQRVDVGALRHAHGHRRGGLHGPDRSARLGQRNSEIAAQCGLRPARYSQHHLDHSAGPRVLQLRRGFTPHQRLLGQPRSAGDAGRARAGGQSDGAPSAK